MGLGSHRSPSHLRSIAGYECISGHVLGGSKDDMQPNIVNSRCLVSLELAMMQAARCWSGTRG